MFPRKNRISKQEFPSPQGLGAPRQQIRISDSKNQLFSASFYKKEGKLQVAVVVSKKVAKTAVARNLIRRRFYSITQEVQKNFIQQGFLVFYPKKEALATDYSVLKSEIETALRNAKLIA